MRRKVSAAKAGGMSEDAIALALGITRPTLAKHFMVELSTGAAVKKMEAVDALFLQAKRGNVAAIKAVLLLGNAIGEPQQPSQQDGEQPAAPIQAAKLGKKEAQQVAAVSAADGTEWAGILPGSSSVQ